MIYPNKELFDSDDERSLIMVLRLDGDWRSR